MRNLFHDHDDFANGHCRGGGNGDERKKLLFRSQKTSKVSAKQERFVDSTASITNENTERASHVVFSQPLLANSSQHPPQRPSENDKNINERKKDKKQIYEEYLDERSEKQNPSGSKSLFVSSDYQKSLITTSKHQNQLLTLSPHEFERAISCEKDSDNSKNNRNDRDRKLRRVTVWQEQGARAYMEDEFVVGPDVIAIFDGHGGRAVSRFLKQNLLSEIQRATALVAQQSQLSTSFVSATKKSLNDKEIDKSGNEHENGLNDPQEHRYSTLPSLTAQSLTVDNYVNSLSIALSKLDNDVQKIRHWSFQGSTAVVAWLHEQRLAQGSMEEDRPMDEYSNVLEKNDDISLHSPTNTTLIVANIGDSRAILSRKGKPVVLTRDHKPNDPTEYNRISARGGRVTMHGMVPRVNGNLALSRAVGDRSERPYVTAEPEFTTISIRSGQDDFVLLATDGLWDVMSNKQVVDFVLSRRKKLFKKQGRKKQPNNKAQQPKNTVDIAEKITKMLVQEALARGSSDNISVVIIWLNDEKGSNT